MIPKEIEELIELSSPNCHRNKDDISLVHDNVKKLQASHIEGFSQFFEKYNAVNIKSKRSEEILDLVFPNNDILETTEWARDIYDLDGNFICITSGEGEGFILISKKNGGIYDVSVSDFDALEKGTVKANWQNFIEFLKWYVS